jgi:hypothetical protein
MRRRILRTAGFEEDDLVHGDNAWSGFLFGFTVLALDALIQVLEAQRPGKRRPGWMAWWHDERLRRRAV